MLLALWADFFRIEDWEGEAFLTNAGSGAGHRKEYDPPSWEYWDEREAQFKRNLPKVEEIIVEIPVEAPEDAPMTPEMLSQAFPNLPDLAGSLRDQRVLSDLVLQFHKHRVKSDEEALLALLL